MACIYGFKRGANAGKTCGRPTKAGGEYCGLHAKCVLQLSELPALVHGAVLDGIVDGDDQPEYAYRRLLGLSRSCKYWRGVIAPLWDVLYARMRRYDRRITHHEGDMERYGLTSQQRISLLSQCGCQECGCPRITKVHWPFPIRVCADCFQAMTISDYRLTHDHGIPHDRFEHLGYTTAELWNRHLGSYSLNFYIVSDVQRAIGCRLSAYRQTAIDTCRARVQSMLGETDAALAAACPRYRAITHAERFAEMLGEVRQQLYRRRAVNAACAALGVPEHDLALSPHATGLVNAATASGDYAAIRAMNVDAANGEIATGRLLRIAGKHTDIRMPSASDPDATALVTAAVARREMLIAAGAELGAYCSQRNAKKPRLTFPVDDDVPVDECRRRLDEKMLQLKRKVDDATAKTNALAELRALSERFNRLGIDVDMDEATVDDAPVAAVAKVVADTKAAMREWLLEELLDEDSCLLDRAREIDPAARFDAFAPVVREVVAALTLPDMLAFAENAKVGIEVATRRMRVDAFQTRAMQVTGKTAEYLSKWSGFARPSDDDLADAERSITRLQRLAVIRAATESAQAARKVAPPQICGPYMQRCPLCPGSARLFGAQGLVDHRRDVHGA